MSRLDESCGADDFYLFENADKQWQKDENHPDGYRGIRRGSRILIYGSPNAGKTNLIKNKIKWSIPPYEKIYIHQSSTRSQEYKDIEYIPVPRITDLPNIDDIHHHNIKTLVILEDMDTINKNDNIILDQYLRYGCSHVGISCVILCQNPISIPPVLRRKCEAFILFLWRADNSFLYSKSIPIPPEDRHALMDFVKEHANQYDYLTIDLTRKNMYSFNDRILTVG
jgi:hypothetical protein